MAVGLLLFGLLIIFLLCGFPIAVCIGAASVFTFLQAGLPLQNFISKFYANINSFTLMAVPFFMFAGALMSTGGMSKRLVRLARAFVGWMSGGLAHVVIIASAFFAALSGSAPATCAAIGGMMIPEMKKNGYPAEFSAAVQCVAGTIGTIIPPSIPMVVYSISAGCSVGAMFAAGFLPGILYALCLMGYSAWVCKKEGIGKESYQTFSWSEVWAAFKDAIWALLVPVIILGGIYTGIFTPTEARVISAFYALIISIFVYHEMTWEIFKDCLFRAGMSTGTILIVVACCAPFAWFMTSQGIPAIISKAILSMVSSRVMILLAINIILLFLGCFLDTGVIILLVTPIFLPIATSVGVGALALGIIMVINTSVGMITPPMAVNLYIASRVSGAKIEEICTKIVPFLIVESAFIIILSNFPTFIEWLPNLLT